MHIRPAHPFNPLSETGIKLIFDGEDIRSELWQIKNNQSQMVESVSSSEMIVVPENKWDYWYNMQFLDDFEHLSTDAWFFGSAWSGRVRFAEPIITPDDDDARTGQLVFVDKNGVVDNYSPQYYFSKSYIDVPFPPLQEYAENLTYKIMASHALAHCVKNRMYNETMIISSVIRPEVMADTFPSSWGRAWLPQVPQVSDDMRKTLCRQLKLLAPWSSPDATEAEEGNL